VVRDTAEGREGSEGSKGSKGSEGEGRRLRRQFVENRTTALAGGEKTYNRAFGAREKRHPLWWLAPPPSPPASLVGLWVLSIVPHDTEGKRRAVYSVPCIGESPAQPDKGWRTQ